MICALIGFPIAAVVQCQQRKPAGSKLARLIAWLASAAFLAGAAMAGIALQNENEFVFAVPSVMRAGLTLWVLELVLSMLLVCLHGPGMAAQVVAAHRRRLAHAGLPRNVRDHSLAIPLESAWLAILTGRRPSRKNLHCTNFLRARTGKILPRTFLPKLKTKHLYFGDSLALNKCEKVVQTNGQHGE
jgi:hypothetical protein